MASRKQRKTKLNNRRFHRSDMRRRNGATDNRMIDWAIMRDNDEFFMDSISWVKIHQ